jgi:hypothetical protein
VKWSEKRSEFPSLFTTLQVYKWLNFEPLLKPINGNYRKIKCVVETLGFLLRGISRFVRACLFACFVTVCPLAFIKKQNIIN